MARRNRAVVDTNVMLIPLINVILLLAFLFMVGASIDLSQRSVSVVLADGTNLSGSSLPGMRVIRVEADGSIWMNSQSLSLADLQQQLQQASAADPNLRVAVRGDGRASFQAISDVMTVVRSIGVQQLAVGADAAQWR